MVITPVVCIQWIGESVNQLSRNQNYIILQ